MTDANDNVPLVEIRSPMVELKLVLLLKLPLVCMMGPLLLPLVVLVITKLSGVCLCRRHQLMFAFGRPK